MREPDVGGLLAIEEADGSTRWEHRDPSDPTARGERLPGHRLGIVALDAASFGVVHDEQGRITQGVNGTYDYGPRGRLVQAFRGTRQANYLRGLQKMLESLI